MWPTSAKSQFCTTKTLCSTATQRYVPDAPPALQEDLDSPGKVPNDPVAYRMVVAPDVRFRVKKKRPSGMLHGTHLAHQMVVAPDGRFSLYVCFSISYLSLLTLLFL